jgi:uncharacterized protein YhaN
MMGIAAYNRGSKKIAQDTRDDYVQRKREEILAGRNYDNVMLKLERDNDDLTSQVERLQAELAELQEQVALRDATIAALQTDLQVAESDVRTARLARDTWKQAHDVHKEKHEICSQVIRLGMTPERYRELREIVRNG